MLHEKASLLNRNHAKKKTVQNQFFERPKERGAKRLLKRDIQL